MKMLNIFTLFFITACTNFGTVEEQPLNTGGNGGSGQSGTKLSITSVSTSTGQNSEVFNVLFSATGTPITRFCRVGATQNSSVQPCSIKFSWKEANQKSGSTIIIPREVKVSLASAQSYLVTGEAPSVYENEIATGTPISIEVIPDSSNSASFSMDPYIFRKGLNNKDPGEIEDELGNVLQNIYEYVCYDKSNKSLEVKSRAATLEGTDPQQQPEEVTALLASNFCAQGITDNIEGCENASGAGESSENFYYNLSVPSSQKGQFNLSNEAYSCPTVLENIDGTRTVPNPYPAQETYALATRVSAEWPVPVEAPSVLGRDNDPSSGPTACLLTGEEPTAPTPGSSTAISSRCIGFAKLPNPNGTCPTFKDVNGVITPTFPLKRYVFDHGYRTTADGKVKEETRAIDIVYVVNRPVVTNNPLSSVSIRGPVPCNQAYFDSAGVTGAGTPALISTYDPLLGMGMPAYRGRNRTEWDLTNVDGTHFPAIDNFQRQSCGTAFPVFDIQNGNVSTASFATSFPGATQGIDLGGGRTLPLSRVYVRPKDSIERRWVLDTSFQACAPLAQQFIEAPLHFAKTQSGDMAWCSERYPSQNSAVELIDDVKGNTNTQAPRPSFVTPFTSHTVKKSSSTQCTFSLPKNPMPSVIQGPGGGTCSVSSPEFVVGAAFHPQSLRADLTEDPSSPGVQQAICSDQTCDRTIVGLGPNNYKVPLLASPSDVEALIRQSKRPTADSDFTYLCAIEGDLIGGKNGQTPSGGCCDPSVVQIPPGQGPLDATTTGHLEPDVACQAPAY